MIRRYDIGREYAHSVGAPAITEQANGAYVRHDDHTALADEWRAEKGALEQIVMTQEVTIAELREGMEAVGAGGVSPLMGSQPVSSDDLRAMNDALCDFALRWKLNGDWLTCRGCKRNLIASRYDESLIHDDGCKKAAATEPKPWRALMEILRPMQAALTQQEQA